jgi:hypothetical protein
MLKQYIPLIAAIILLFCGAVFTYFESIYLQDQAAEIGSNASKIVMWMWFFRLITTLFVGVGASFLYLLVKRLANP